jgi:short-subunit dehydrogenase
VNYFVTGATGFIGRHLVEELLKREGTVYALVREGSKGRLDALGKRLGADDRLVPVPGDLSKERLGIEAFDERIDHFFHLAAVYDMQSDEETMRRANVEGTRHVMEFANSIDVGRFHHASSIAVAGRFKGLFREDMFDEGQKLPHAYHSTKFESEKLVREGIEAPLRVYRPGIVIGHSETGEMDKIDGPYYFFKLIQKLRHALPEWFPLAGPEGKKANIVPVDFVAKAMDHIAHMDDSDLYGNTFHLVDPKPLSVGRTLNEFAKAAHAPQFAMRVDAHLTDIVPKQVTKGIMQIPTVKGIRDQILADLEIPPVVLENRDFEADFDARDTQRALTGTGVAVPPLSSYADKVWDYWERNLDPDLFRERSLSSVVKDKVIVVTGASSGIGREVAKKIGEAGGAVILVARTREKLEELREQVEEAGGRAHVHPADLSDMDDIERVADEILDQHGAVDILVNNAGRSIRRSVEASYDRFHDYERTMQLNYFGAVRLILKLLPGMRERGSGHIVTVSAYVASKAALDAFSRCMAPEVVGDGVSVTTVYMPLVRTPMIAPTSIYDAFPTLSPEEAAQLVADAILDKPKRVATRLGTFGQVLYSISPKAVDQIMNTAYKIFPDSRPAKKKDGAEEDGKREEQMSTEAVAMAYLLRGVHF